MRNRRDGRVDLRSDTSQADAGDARGDGGRRGRRRAVPRGSDDQRAAAPDGRAARPRGGALPADRDDGEPGRAPYSDGPAASSLAEERTHVLIYEWGGPAIHSGLVMRASPPPRAASTPEQIGAEVDELGPGSIVVLENTHRSSGGRDLAARRVRRCGRGGSRARRRSAPRRRAALQRFGRAPASSPADWASARRLRDDLLLEGPRLPVRRRPRRLGGD